MNTGRLNALTLDGARRLAVVYTQTGAVGLRPGVFARMAGATVYVQVSGVGLTAGAASAVSMLARMSAQAGIRPGVCALVTTSHFYVQPCAAGVRPGTAASVRQGSAYLPAVGFRLGLTSSRIIQARPAAQAGLAPGVFARLGTSVLHAQTCAVGLGTGLAGFSRVAFGPR